MLYWRNIYIYGNNDRERMPAMYIYNNNPWKMHFRFRTNKYWNDGLDFDIPTALREYNEKLKLKLM